MRFTSRKFMLAVSSIVLIVLNEIVGLGIDPDAYQSIVLAVIGYLGGEGIVDAARAGSGNEGSGGAQ